MTREIVATKKQDWATPRPFFAALHEEYGFTLDACAARYNACLERFYGPGSPIAEDGLRVSWAGERVFCNPPYEDIDSWLRKGLMSSMEGCTSIFLIPANPDTLWFHKYAVVGQVDFIKGRLSFEDLTPPALELERVLALYKAKPAENLLKRMALLLNELPPVSGDLPGVSEAALLCASLLLEEVAGVRKPGPGFPSMLVTFDPNAPAGAKPFRTRDKTGALL